MELILLILLPLLFENVLESEKNILKVLNFNTSILILPEPSSGGSENKTESKIVKIMSSVC